MIVPLWRGWTAAEIADRYETQLKPLIFPGILGRNIAGFEGIELLAPGPLARTELDAIVGGALGLHARVKT